MTEPQLPTPAPAPMPAPIAPAKKKLSTGAIVGIVIGAVVLLGIIVVGVLAAIAVPVFNSQQAKDADLNAKVDVSTLGKEIATGFVDSSEMPSITVSGDTYVFTGGTSSFTVTKSEGVEFGGLAGSNSTNWCVWVTAADGELKDFEYSAVGGLANGRC